PPGRAISAVTGIESTSLTRFCSNLTVTGAWSRPPPWVFSGIVSVIVAPELVVALLLLLLLELDVAVATLPTDPIRARVTCPDGSCTLTSAPFLARLDLVVSSFTVTTLRVEVVVMIVFEGVDAAPDAEEACAALVGVLALEVFALLGAAVVVVGVFAVAGFFLAVAGVVVVGVGVGVVVVVVWVGVGVVVVVVSVPVPVATVRSCAGVR